MQKFKCHKEVHAKPMTRGDYCNYRGWDVPADEDPADEGYFIIYNKDTTDHYESWTPKKQFDDGYTETCDPEEFSGIVRYFAYKHLP